MSKQKLERIEERICSSKKMYWDKKYAKKAAAAANQRMGNHLRFYRCPFCNHYHLGHRTTAPRHTRSDIRAARVQHA